MFNKQASMKLYSVDNEKDLRLAITGKRSAITNEEINTIFEYLEVFDNPVYAEVGVYFGGTFSKVLSYLHANKQQYWAHGFDLFEDLQDETFGVNQTHDIKNKWNILNVAFKAELEESLKNKSFDNFTLYKGCSDEKINKTKMDVDLVLIDGNHTYKQVKLDFEALLKKCKKGSIIVFDNSSNNIEPDPRYVALDGGPWKFCEELKKDSRVKHAKKIHRCTFFSVN